MLQATAHHYPSIYISMLIHTLHHANNVECEVNMEINEHHHVLSSQTPASIFHEDIQLGIIQERLYP